MPTCICLTVGVLLLFSWLVVRFNGHEDRHSVSLAQIHPRLARSSAKDGVHGSQVNGEATRQLVRSKSFYFATMPIYKANLPLFDNWYTVVSSATVVPWIAG